MVEPAGHNVAGSVAQQLADRFDDGREHLLAVLLHPPRSRVADDLVAPCLAHNLKPLVEQGRLDTGGALVDSQQEQGPIPIGPPD